MANDAKLGLVLGVAVVLVIGLVFFRTESAAAKLPATPAQQTSHHPKDGVAPFYPSAQIDAARPR
jgi:hypothetical protein